MITRGKTIQIYLPFGDPHSIRYAGLTNGIVRLIEIPRVELQHFEKMEYAEQAAVYFLIGYPSDEKPLLYIGQSNNVAKRLKQHNNEKDFWEKALVAVSLTNNLTAVHTQFLEKIAIQRAIEANRYILDNANSGSQSSYTPDWIESDCEDIFDNISMLLSTLSQPIFENLGSAKRIEKEKDFPIFSCIAKHCDAKGYYSNEGFVILKDSLVRRKPVNSLSELFKNKLNELLKSNIIKVYDEDRFIFLENYLMSSPSGASQLVSGRSSNGWVEWKTHDGKTLSDIYRSDVISEEN